MSGSLGKHPQTHPLPISFKKGAILFLCQPQTKLLVESAEHTADDTKTELAPAERADRIKKQAARLAGVPLRGENECAYQSYNTAMKMCQENVVAYMPPNKFPSRREYEPKKNWMLSTQRSSYETRSSRFSIRLNKTPLNLHHALHRRALALGPRPDRRMQ